MTEQEVSDFLAVPGKLVIRPVCWTTELGGHAPPWVLFESAIQVGDEISVDFRIRARYRAPKVLSKGVASIEIGESFSVALFGRTKHRVYALDTIPNQRHTNRIGIGRPHYEQCITTPTHRHVWIGEYGYVEPVEPPVLSIVKMLELFAVECKLSFIGPLQDPRLGEQGELGL